MVEVLIEEMFGSDWSRPKDYRRAVVVDTGVKEHDEQRNSSEWTVKCAQKEIDRADVVRDVRLGVPAQPVDATPSNQLVRQYFPLKNRSVWLTRPKPSQGNVPADLT